MMNIVRKGKNTAEGAKKTKGSSVRSLKKLSNEEIFSLVQKKAYDLYEKSGYAQGNDVNNWTAAEKTVIMELKNKKMI